MVPIALLVFSGTVLGVMGIQITNMRVPKAVKHNLYSPVVLDCDYTLTPEEKNADAYGGLVVKWYLNNFDSPVYQWIPGKKPQDLGVLKGRLDVNYRASDNPATMHRALYIRNPTTDLSGDYKCLVSTFNDEDFMVKRMVVYATQKVLQMEQTKPTPEMLNLTCKATSVYPEPKMTLYKDPDSKSTGSSMLEGVTVKVIPQHRSYDIVAWKVMEEMELPTVFACQLSIPDTDYVVRKSFVYYPGIFQSSIDSGVACSSISYYWMALLLLAVLMPHFFC